ncbi:FdhF/YdeP family oxidoreductase [soil metagenome]
MEKTKQVSVVGAETPERFTGLKLKHPLKVAGGAKAVINSMRHVFGAMNVPRGLKALAALNQTYGPDCPGCAWPDPEHRSSIAEYCENGAKAISEESTTDKIGAAFFSKHSVAELAELSDYEIGKKGRLAEPMYLPEGGTHYQPISWDKAFLKIATYLKNVKSPDDAVFYTSGRTSNEAAFLYQLFVREFGTNNLPDCSNMCHESSGVALTESLGIGKGSVKLEDFYEAEVILVLGQNPGTNHPRMLSALQSAKENGAKIIAINPLKETGLLAFSHPQQLEGALGIATSLTDIYLQVKINSDLSLLKAIALLMLQAEDKNVGGVFDSDFIEAHTSGYTDYSNHLRKQNLKTLLAATGVEESLVRKAADLLIHKKKIIACWAMGLTQHKNAVDTIREIVNILLLKGSIGKPGAGTCPVRGHSNVQGDRTMGIYEKPSKKFLDALKNTYGFTPPEKHGYDTVEAIHAMHEGKVDVFFAMGGNFLSATPDTNYTAKAIQQCKLTVQVSTKLNRSHLITGKEAIILPCLGRTDKDLVNGVEQFVTVENSMGIVHKSTGNLNPISEHLLSEPVIVAKLAVTFFGDKSLVPWKSYLLHYDTIRSHIEKTIPGFNDYNTRVRRTGGFYLPNGSREGTFNTLSGTAEFNVADVIEQKIEDDEFIMMTIRSHDQFNTTIYGLDDRYRGIFNERRIIMMNPKDIYKAGLSPGEVVDLYNFHEDRERVARKFIVVAYDIPERCTATYFPETNILVPINSTADKSNTPTSKMVVIQIRKSEPSLIND